MWSEVALAGRNEAEDDEEPAATLMLSEAHSQDPNDHVTDDPPNICILTYENTNNECVQELLHNEKLDRLEQWLSQRSFDAEVRNSNFGNSDNEFRDGGVQTATVYLYEADCWTENVVNRLMELLVRFPHGPWKSLMLGEGPYRWMERLMLCVHRFQSLHVHQSWLDDANPARHDEQQEIWRTLFFVMKTPQNRLETLHMEYCRFHENTCERLCQMLIRQGRLKHLSLKDCQWSGLVDQSGNYCYDRIVDEEARRETDRFIRPGIVYWASGLMGNSTLESLTIHGGYDCEDFELGIIIRGLVGHTALQNLSLAGQDFGSQTLQSLGNVLSLRRSFQELQLMRHARGRSGNSFATEEFIQHVIIPSSDCVIASISLSHNEIGVETGRILQAMQTSACATETLDLSDNDIDYWMILTSGLDSDTDESKRSKLGLHGRFPRLCTLILDGNHCASFTGDPHHQHRLLDAFPRLGSLGRECMEALVNHEDDAPLAANNMAVLCELDWRRLYHKCKVHSNDDSAIRQSLTPNESLWPWIMSRIGQDLFLQHKEEDSNKVKRRKEIRKATVRYRLLQELALVAAFCRSLGPSL